MAGRNLDSVGEARQGGDCDPCDFVSVPRILAIHYFELCCMGSMVSHWPRTYRSTIEMQRRSDGFVPAIDTSVRRLCTPDNPAPQFVCDRGWGWGLTSIDFYAANIVVPVPVASRKAGMTS